MIYKGDTITVKADDLTIFNMKGEILDITPDIHRRKIYTIRLEDGRLAHLMGHQIIK